MRLRRWGIVIGLCPKPPPQHHDRPSAAPQGASQITYAAGLRRIAPCPTHASVVLGQRHRATPEAAAPTPRPPQCSPPKGLPKHGYRTEATEKSIIIFSLSKAIMIIIVFSYALIWPYKCYLCGWFAADCPPAPPMRPWRWGNVIGLRPKPPPQHHGRPDAAPQGASQTWLPHRGYGKVEIGRAHV